MTSAAQTIGNSLQLIGAIITGFGLFYAWNRASRRFDEWRGTLQTRLKELRAFVVSLGRGLTREASTDLAVAVNDVVAIADVVAEMELTQGGTVEERLRRVEKEADDLRDRLTKSLSSIPTEIENAIATEFERFESLSNAKEMEDNAFKMKDIYWALAGVVVGAVGIVVQLLCA